MARTITFMKAINEALDQAMAKDERVVLLGEDISGGTEIEHLEEKMKMHGVVSLVSPRDWDQSMGSIE